MECRFERVRLTGGTVATLPVDWLAWTGDTSATRVHRSSEGEWYVDARGGRWQLHKCGRTN